MGQRVAERIANWVGGGCRTGEIAFAAGIAPRPLRVPVPGFDREFGVLAVGDGLPAGGGTLSREAGSRSLSIAATGMRSTPAPKVWLGTKWLVEWPGVMSTWMVWAAAIAEVRIAIVISFCKTVFSGWWSS